MAALLTPRVQVQQSTVDYSFYQTIVSKTQKLMEMSLCRRIHSEIMAVLIPDVFLLHDNFNTGKYTCAFSILVAEQRKTQAF
jgi:hypothetical protein